MARAYSRQNRLGPEPGPTATQVPRRASRLMMTRTKRKLLAVVTLVATATSAHATVQIDSSMKYYDVVGTTSGAILASLNSHGPLVDGKRMWAKTHWKINVNYYYRADKDACRFTSVTTPLNIEITMPQLVTKVSAHIRKWFDEKIEDASRARARPPRHRTWHCRERRRGLHQDAGRDLQGTARRLPRGL